MKLKPRPKDEPRTINALSVVWFNEDGEEDPEGRYGFPYKPR